MHEVHEPFMMIIMMTTFRSIKRQLKEVRSKTESLSIGIREDTRLKQLIIRVVYPRNNDRRTKGKLLILRKEVINVLVQHHTPNGLKRQKILRPGLGHIERIKVELIFISRVNDLDKELPLRVVPSSNGVVKVLSGVAVVGSSYTDCIFF